MAIGIAVVIWYRTDFYEKTTPNIKGGGRYGRKIQLGRFRHYVHTGWLILCMGENATVIHSSSMAFRNSSLPRLYRLLGRIT